MRDGRVPRTGLVRADRVDATTQPSLTYEMDGGGARSRIVHVPPAVDVDLQPVAGHHSRGAEQPALARHRDGSQPVGHPEFPVDVLQVPVNRTWRDAQPTSYRNCGQPLTKQL